MSLFAAYLKALEPDKLLDVIPQDILKVLMRGFFHSDRVGMTLLYKDKATQSTVGEFFELNPDYGPDKDIKSYWNPFCRKLREEMDGKWDSLCRECDARQARIVYAESMNRVEGYTCHMGLKDFSCGLKVGGQTAGVLLAGQIAPKEEEKYREMTANRISTLLMEKAVPGESYGLMFQEFLERLDENARNNKQIQEFEDNYEAFTGAVQRTIDALYFSKLNQEAQRAIVQVNDYLSDHVTTRPDSLIGPAQEVLNGLEEVLPDCQFFFLVRRYSHYQVIAASRSCSMPESPVVVPPEDTEISPQMRLSAYLCLNLREKEWQPMEKTDWKHVAWRAEMRWLPKKRLLTYRFDESSDVSAPLSSVLVIIGNPFIGPKEIAAIQKDLVRECAEAIAYHANMGTLFEHQRGQEAEFRRRVSFTGHHLKTPLQNAFSTLRDIARLGDRDPRAQQMRIDLCAQVRKQLEEAQADALMLQATTRAEAERVDLHFLLHELIKQFEARSRERNNSIFLSSFPEATFLIRGIPAHLRSAFTNLLDNAIKYSFANQKIDVVVQAFSRRQVLVSVTNTGVGFMDRPTEKRKRPARLFKYATRGVELDRKRERPGQGIGLSQTAKLLEEHGGAFHIESEPVGSTTREGIRIHKTTVIVLLPLIFEHEEKAK